LPSRDPYPTPRLLNGPRVCLSVWFISRSPFFCRSWSGHLRFSCLFASSCDGIFLGRIERFPRPSAQSSIDCFQASYTSDVLRVVLIL
jgi:hypothetical protein